MVKLWDKSYTTFMVFFFLLFFFFTLFNYKKRYLLSTSHLFNMMENVNNITDSARRFLDFGSQVNTCHGDDLKQN